MMYYFISFLLLIIMIFLSVMYITMLERKLLSSTQLRKGPNKVSILGLFQPILDGVKLLVNEALLLILSNKIMFYMGPFLMLILSFFMWLIIMKKFVLINFVLIIMFFMAIFGMNVYTSLITGWCSNSKYSMLGGIRLMVQSISYEICLSLLIFNLMVMNKSFSLSYIYLMQTTISIFLSQIIMSIMLFICLLAETNRLPFDFAEGESELVSGFNVELSSGFFALISISEYSSIMFVSWFMFSLYFGMSLWILFIMICSILFVRSVYPRYRYDKLMYLTWFKLLPIVCLWMFMCFMY